MRFLLLFHFWGCWNPQNRRDMDSRIYEKKVQIVLQQSEICFRWNDFRPANYIRRKIKLHYKYSGLKGKKNWLSTIYCKPFQLRNNNKKRRNGCISSISAAARNNEELNGNYCRKLGGKKRQNSVRRRIKHKKEERTENQYFTIGF